MSEDSSPYKTGQQLATRNIDPAPLATAAQSLGPEIERVLVGGDLSKLNADQRVSYVQAICRSMGMNPLTRPFDYVTLQGKLTLYARKDATEQLRLLRGVSVTEMKREQIGDLLLCTCHVATPDGRTDQATGVVNVAGLRGEALANAFMKVETKAKRRATLSIVGLGFMDESEFTETPVTPTDGSEPAQANGPKAGTRKMFPKKEKEAPPAEQKPDPVTKPEPEIQDAEVVEPEPEPEAPAEPEFQPTPEQETLAKHRKPYLEGVWKEFALEEGGTLGELDKNAKNKLIVTVKPENVELRAALDAMMIDVIGQQTARAGSSLAEYATAQGWTHPLYADTLELTKMIAHFRQQAAKAQ